MRTVYHAEHRRPMQWVCEAVLSLVNSRFSFQSLPEKTILIRQSILNILYFRLVSQRIFQVFEYGVQVEVFLWSPRWRLSTPKRTLNPLLLLLLNQLVQNVISAHVNITLTCITWVKIIIRMVSCENCNKCYIILLNAICNVKNEK